MVLEVCEYYATVKIKHKFLHEVAEQRDLNPGEMIYIHIRSQNNTDYEGTKNWILIQDSDTEQKRSFFTKAKEYLAENSPLSLIKLIL